MGRPLTCPKARGTAASAQTTICVAMGPSQLRSHWGAGHHLIHDHRLHKLPGRLGACQASWLPCYSSDSLRFCADSRGDKLCEGCQGLHRPCKLRLLCEACISHLSPRDQRLLYELPSGCQMGGIFLVRISRRPSCCWELHPVCKCTVSFT